MSSKKMKIPTKASTQKAGQDKVVEEIKGNLPEDLNYPPVLANLAIKADRKSKQSSYQDAGSFGKPQHPFSKSNSFRSRT